MMMFDRLFDSVEIFLIVLFLIILAVELTEDWTSLV